MHDQQFYEKISLLNQTIIECLNEADERKILRAFTDLGIEILDADFGFVWFNSYDSNELKLVYKTPGLPYTPKAPRKEGRNYRVMRSSVPDFVTKVKKRSDAYDVSRYMKSFVIIPIAHRGSVYGNIVFCFKKTEIFSKEKKTLCIFIGNSVAQAITIHRLLAGEQESRLAAERNEARFRALVENSHETIMMVNASGKISYVSPASVRMFGHAPASMTGRHLFDFISSGDHRKARAYVKAIIAKSSGPTDTRLVAELSCYRKDGSTGFIECTGIHLLKNAGIRNILINMRDITERKRSERILERERAYEEEKVKTEFIADATHELRTPLAIIKGNLDLALRSAITSKEAFHAIDHEVRHMSELISDMTLLTNKGKTFSEVSGDSEKKPNEREKTVSREIPIRRVIDRTVKRCATFADRRGISVRTERIPDVAVSGDELYLEKLFTNLIRNAVIYGKKGGYVAVRGSTSRSKKGMIVHIEVADNGIGISARDIPYIFERFYRSDAARAENHEGSGLGLAIVKWIAAAHGGTVAATSVEKKGSTFRLSFPAIIIGKNTKTVKK